MNTSAIQEIFKRIVSQFSKMFQRKAFLHWFQGEGVDEEDFQVSEHNLNNLCDEYHIYEEAEIESSDDEVTPEPWQSVRFLFLIHFILLWTFIDSVFTSRYSWPLNII